MGEREFEDAIQNLRQRLADLQRRAGEASVHRETFVVEVLEELSHTVAELQLAVKELREQAVERAGSRQRTEVERLRWLLRNVSERKREEVRLRESELKYRRLVEQIPAVTYISAIDENGSTLYVSPHIETLLGYSQSEWMVNTTLWSSVCIPTTVNASWLRVNAAGPAASRST